MLHNVTYHKTPWIRPGYTYGQRTNLMSPYLGAGLEDWGDFYTGGGKGLYSGEKALQIAIC